MVKKLRQVVGGMKHPMKNLYVLTPLVILLLIAQIRLALGKVRNGPTQIWSFTPDIAYALGYFNEEKAVYYCVDDHASFSSYDKAQVLRDEEELCQRADLVVTTSMALQEANAP